MRQSSKIDRCRRLSSSSAVTVVVTIAGKTPEYVSYCLPSVAKYCHRFGYRMKIMDSPPADDRHPSWQKLLAWQIVDDDCEIVCLVDADMFILPWCPPLEKYVPKDAIGITQQRGTFQCGFWTVPRSQSSFLTDVYATGNWRGCGTLYEQTDVNRRLENGDAPVHVLAPAWNFLAPRRLRMSNVIGRKKSVWILHAAGAARRYPKVSHCKKWFEEFIDHSQWG